MCNNIRKQTERHLGSLKASSGLSGLTAQSGPPTFPCGKTLSSMREFTLSDPLAFRTMRSQDHCEAENLFHMNRPSLNSLKRGKKIKKEPRETIRKKNWPFEWNNCWCLSAGIDILTKGVSVCSLLYLQGENGKTAQFTHLS